MRPAIRIEEARTRLLPRPGRRYWIQFTASCSRCWWRSDQGTETAARTAATHHTCPETQP